MRLWLITILTLLSLTNQSHAGCWTTIKKLTGKGSPFANTAEYQRRTKRGRIERVANFFRRGKENQDPAQNIRIYKKVNVLSENILNGLRAPNERRWRTFFREFEADYYSFVRSKEISDYLENNTDIPLDTFIAKLDDFGFSESYKDFVIRRLEEFGNLEDLRKAFVLEKNHTLVKLANDYQEYRIVLGSMTDLKKRSDCDESCKNIVDSLLGRLGAESDKEKLMNAMFFEGVGRPDISTMRSLLYAEELFRMTKIKRERNEEIFAFFRSFLLQPQVVDQLFGIIYKSDLAGKTRAVQLMKWIYDAQARNQYFPKINRIIYGADSTKRDLDALVNANSVYENDEIMITFARRKDPPARNKWKELKKFAVDNADEKEVHEQMVKAEEKAKARGALSATQDTSLVARLAALTVVGGAAYGYFYFDALPTSVQEIISGNETGESDDPLDDGPIPPEGIDVPVNGELDEAIQEVGEAIMEDTTGEKVEDIPVGDESSRTPSSVTKWSASFTNWWCSIFTCRSH